MTAGWYEHFFQGLALEMWRMAIAPEQTQLEADFLEREFRLRPGARVLDVACGLGRHSLELAARGYGMTAVDLSPQMLAEGRQAAAERGLGIEWWHADMRDLPWDGAFDAAFCLGNSFGYLDPQGSQTFVRAVARALRPGAWFALDYGMAAECILPRFQEREEAQIGDIHFLEESRYDAAESRIETRYTFTRDGRAETHTGWHWVYTTREVRRFFTEAGLEPRTLLAGARGEAFHVGAPVLLVVAQRT